MRTFLNLPRHQRAARQQAQAEQPGNAAGFSLMELVIAMAILLVMMAGASHVLMNSLGARTRENQKSDALADAQRALNIMSREIGNSGFGLDYNGLVAADCHPTAAADPIKAQLRFRANVNNTDASTAQTDEDVTYVYQGAPTNAIVRYDRSTNTRTVLATPVNAMQITYINAAGGTSTLATPAVVTAAERIRITIQVDLPRTVGQSSTPVLLTSDIALRNAPNVVRRY
jgi:prepilin-type N-terminal cleavage/methylation domain-containing protein